MDICRKNTPPLRALEPDHSAACWLYGKENSAHPDSSTVRAKEKQATHECRTASSDLLIVEDLVKHFPFRRGFLAKGAVRAVDGVSFSIPKGSTLSLVGESGCGKTTAGRCILRLTEPTSGRILFDGINLGNLGSQALRAERRRLQIISKTPTARSIPG